HRMLTASEFLQMSGRAGRRGMDEVGYVTVIGTQFQTPEEVAELVLSDANPLESRFSPSYSMVLNLLQHFSLAEAKELILKSFGYFSSGSALQSLLKAVEMNEKDIIEREFDCPFGHNDDDLYNYEVLRKTYVQNRQTFKKICKQERAKNRPLSQEALKFGSETKAMLEKMHTFACDNCKLYRKHAKNIEVTIRLEQKQQKLVKEIEKQRDIFWNKFLSHRAVLAEVEYLRDDYPSELGVMTSQINSENELFIAEIINSKVLESLSPAQLAGVVCAIITEDLRTEIPYQPISEQVRKTLNLIRNIRRKIDKIQVKHGVEAPMYINPYFSTMIETWVDGADWDKIVEQVDMGEGDIVRSFKRVVDVLRQFTNIANVPEALVYNAREAVDGILREPVNID
ncbi:MAG: hypothetical protein R3Y28_05840, partial [Candidatus Gastranaerophilales bacterium]